MNMVEAIHHLKDDGSVWVRPVSWKGFRMAYDWRRDRGIVVVPSPRGGDRTGMPSLEEITGEWEVLTPSQVLDE